MTTPTDIDGKNPPKTWTKEQADQTYQALADQNAATLESITNSGNHLDPMTMLKLRLDFVTEWLMPIDQKTQYDFAIAWERFVETILTQAQIDATNTEVSDA